MTDTLIPNAYAMQRHVAPRHSARNEANLVLHGMHQVAANTTKWITALCYTMVNSTVSNQAHLQSV